MSWTIIVASGEGDQLEALRAAALEITKTIAEPGTSVVPADSVEDVKKQRKWAAESNQLLIVAASLPDDAPRDPHAAPGLELIKSIAAESETAVCILVSEDINHLACVQEMARCELLYVDCKTSYVRDCLRLARKLRVVAPGTPDTTAAPVAAVPASGGAPAAAPRVPARNAAGGDPDGASQYALVEVHLLANAHGIVMLDRASPQPLELNQNDIDLFIKESRALAERMNKARGEKEDWQRYLRKWRAEYQRLGERVGSMLWPTSFGPLYWTGYANAKGNIRLRFNLDQSYFDGAWEAIHDPLVGKNFVMLDHAVTVTRRANHLDLRNLSALGKSSVPAQLDISKGVLKVLVIESAVPDGSTPDGPADLLWENYWRSLNGTLSALPHLKTEINMLRGLARARGGMDRDGQPQPQVEVEVLSPRAGKPLAEVVESRLKDRTRPYDIIHFAGHALFAPSLVPQDRRGYLIFSGEPGGEPRAVPVATFADWLDGSGVQLVFLSCCRSSSAAAASELAARNVPVTIGFSWDLDDQKAVDFARDFYTELLASQLKACEAFAKARRKLHRTFDGGDPIWAAPVLIAQPDEWARVEGVLRPLAAPSFPPDRALRKSSVRRRSPGPDRPSQAPQAA
jgi:CHAT domain-containing protein